MGAWSGVGVVLGLAMFLVSFAPSLLPRQWLGQGLVGGASAAVGYLFGFLLEMTADALMRLLDLEVQVNWRMPGGYWILAALGVLAVVGGWVWSWREHRETARLVDMREPPFWHDIASTAVALAFMVVLALLIEGVVVFTVWVSHGFDLFLPSLVSVIGGIVVLVIVARLINHMVFRQALVWITRQADRLNQRRPNGVRAPQLAFRSGSPGSSQSWDELGRRGQIFTACGPSAARIAGVTGRPALEPIRIYAAQGNGTVDEAVAIAMDEVRRTDALSRSTVVIDTPAGRGWVDEFSVQSVEYLTDGDCATIAVQYSKLASAFVFVADRDTPRVCARAILSAVEAAIAELPADRRPKLFVSGESLGAYGGHGAFDNADDMLARVDGAVWIGTPGFTEIAKTLTRSRMRGSPEITPVIDNGRQIRFATKPTELVADAYGRTLGDWETPRVVYAQHASDPMCRFTADLAWREPDWMRERAGSDVNASLRWWPLVTWFQVSTDMLTSLDTPSGHGHIYHDELVPLWAAVLQRTDAPVTAIVNDIRESLASLRVPLVDDGRGASAVSGAAGGSARGGSGGLTH